MIRADVRLGGPQANTAVQEARVTHCLLEENHPIPATGTVRAIA